MEKININSVSSTSSTCTRAVSGDWSPFAQNLEGVLVSLSEDQYLILSAKRGNRFLQFSCQGDWGMRVEVSSNHFLEGKDRLSRKETAWLRAHGWNAPTGTPKKATPDKDPDGSPNYFVDFPANMAVSELVTLVIETLIRGLGVPYPGALTYESFDSESGPLIFKTLGLKPGGQKNDTLMAKVLSVLRGVTGIEDLEPDEDGDVSVRYGVIVIAFVELENKIRIFSSLITGVQESKRLLRKLNHINDGGQRLRCAFRDGIVYASLDVPSVPFVPEHLADALREFSNVAEGLAIVLRADYAGNSVIESAAPALTLQ